MRPALASASSIPVPNAGPLGIDVADYQGDVPWSKVAAEGVKWAYIKATQGTSLSNSYFQQQYEGAYNAGIIRGAYVFATPNTSSGASQARFFADNGGGWSSDGMTLPGMVDLEYDPYPLPSGQDKQGPTMCWGLSAAQMVSWIQSFVDTYHSIVGRRPAIYAGLSWWDTCTNSSSAFGKDSFLDLASWPMGSLSTTSRPGQLPPSWSNWTFWQFYGGNSPITGNVISNYDQDVFNGSYSELKGFALGFDPPTVNWSGPAGVVQGSSLRTGWSFTAPNVAGYQGWAQSWGTPATGPQFDGPPGGWMLPGTLPVGTHRPVVTFFVDGHAYPVYGPKVTVAAWTPPSVKWSGPAGVVQGSSLRTGWSFTAPNVAGYQGWAQSWDTPATGPQFDGPTGGWMLPGTLPVGTHRPVVTFFVDGHAYPVYGPTVMVIPSVNWAGPAGVVQGSSLRTGWSFTAPNVAGYQGWAQSWDTPATGPQFDGPTGGWMLPGTLPVGTHTPIVTFFYYGKSYSVYGPTVTVIPSVKWSGPAGVVQGSSLRTGWSFTAPNVAGYQGWAQSWDTPATGPQFDGPTGGWMLPGTLPVGTHRPVVTFFVDGRAYPVYGPTVTVTKA